MFSLLSAVLGSQGDNQDFNTLLCLELVLREVGPGKGKTMVNADDHRFHLAARLALEPVTQKVVSYIFGYPDFMIDGRLFTHR
jgi:hypothetical protein